MIRTEAEYKSSKKHISDQEKVAESQREALFAQGFSEQEVEAAMEPLLCFHSQWKEEVVWYESVRDRQFSPVNRLTDIGRLLIALRIANGLSQKDLASRLDVSEAMVSRDERNEYHGITLERAQKVLDALDEKLTTSVDEPKRELAGVA